MSRAAIGTLKAVIGLALLGSLLVQGVVLSLLWHGDDPAADGLRVPFVALALVGVLTLQVVGLCVWRLLTMVRRGTVFSDDAFRYVDVVIGSLATGAVVVLGFAVLGAVDNRTHPGDEVAPGLVGLVCGIALVIGGVALLVYVMRTLLAQAVALDGEAAHLRTELSGVV